MSGSHIILIVLVVALVIVGYFAYRQRKAANSDGSFGQGSSGGIKMPKLGKSKNSSPDAPAGFSAGSGRPPVAPPGFGAPANAPTPAPTPAPAPAGWNKDPSGRFQLRYWDGTAWTGHVTNPDGSQAFDPPPA